MKMTIEYEIYGRDTVLHPKFIEADDFIDAIKRDAELSLRQSGVFGPIDHKVHLQEGEEGSNAWVSSSGKRFLREVTE